MKDQLTESYGTWQNVGVIRHRSEQRRVEDPAAILTSCNIGRLTVHQLHHGCGQLIETRMTPGTAPRWRRRWRDWHSWASRIVLLTTEFSLRPRDFRELCEVDRQHLAGWRWGRLPWYRHSASSYSTADRFPESPSLTSCTRDSRDRRCC